jgi:hypothetical protein
MKKIILIFILFISISSFLFCEETKMIINYTRYTGYENNILLTAEQPIKRFSLKREARLFDASSRGVNLFFLEHPSGVGLNGGINKGTDIVSKIDYEQEINKKKYKYYYIFHKTLPVGTEFELVKVVIDGIALDDCHYWIKLINDPEYKDVLIDAVALTNVDDNFAFNPSWWKFIEYEKIDGKLERKKIIVEKVPMFKGKWAKEIKEKK